MNPGKIVIIGFGNMGRALARGLRKETKLRKRKPFDLIACVRHEDAASHTPLPERELRGITILHQNDIYWAKMTPSSSASSPRIFSPPWKPGNRYS